MAIIAVIVMIIGRKRVVQAVDANDVEQDVTKVSSQ